MKKRLVKIISLLSLALCLIMSFSGCLKDDGYCSYDYDYDSSISSVQITTHYLDFEEDEEDIKTLFDKICSETKNLGGSVKDQSSSYDNKTGNYIYVDLTLIIPDDKVETFLNNIGKDEVVINQSEKVVDISKQKQTNLSEIEKIEAQIKTWEALKEQSTDISDTIEILKKIDELNNEKKTLLQEKDKIDELTSYTRINISISQKDYTALAFLIIFTVIITGVLIALIIVVVHVAKKKKKDKLNNKK